MAVWPPVIDENGGVARSTSVRLGAEESVFECGVGVSRHPELLLRARDSDSFVRRLPRAASMNGSA